MSAHELRDASTRQGQETGTAEERQRLPQVEVIDGRQDGAGSRPVDTYNIVFLVLLLHGIGTLMPWNMFINADAYFTNSKLVYPTNRTSDGTNGAISVDVSEEELTAMRKNFLSYLGLAAQIPNVLFNGLNLLVNIGSGNLKLRVNLALVVEALVFILTIVLAVVDSSSWPGKFFYTTLISVIVLNMASGIYQNCVFGTGAKFPGNYTNALLIGSNTSGTFTSIVNLLTIYLAPEPQVAAMYYFITALFVILACIISYNLLPMNPFFRHYDSPDDSQAMELELPTSASAATTGQDVPETLRGTVEAMVPRPVDNRAADDNSLLRKWQVFKKCWPQCLNVFLVFYVTLALFPAVMARIQQVNTGGFISAKYFTSFACFFLFNLFAMIGNLISGWTTWPGKDRVWILVVIRFLFVPFFLFCNYIPQTRTWPVLFPSDSAFIFGNILLAISSGYLSSLCMMFASSNLDPSEAPKAGMLAAFFLVFGIFLGISSSLIFSKIVEL